jgi:hypothetical protein
VVDGLAGLCGECDNYLIRARRNLHRLNFRVPGRGAGAAAFISTGGVRDA